MTKKLIDNNYNIGRYGNKTRGIVMHTYGGPGTSLYNWFNRPTTRASAHYAVMFDGTVEQYVENKDTAWHASNGDVNRRTIGIEHQDDGKPNDSNRTDKLYDAAAHLVAKLCIEYKIPCKLLPKNEAVRNLGEGGISLHNYYDTRPCPSGLDVDRIIKLANNIMKPKPDNLYRVYKNRKQIGAYKNKDNAFDKWYNENANKVMRNGKDITSQIRTIMTRLEKKLNLISKTAQSADNRSKENKKDVVKLKEQDTKLKTAIQKTNSKVKNLGFRVAKLEKGGVSKPNKVLNFLQSIFNGKSKDKSSVGSGQGTG